MCELISEMPHISLHLSDDLEQKSAFTLSNMEDRGSGIFALVSLESMSSPRITIIHPVAFLLKSSLSHEDISALTVDLYKSTSCNASEDC